MTDSLNSLIHTLHLISKCESLFCAALFSFKSSGTSYNFLLLNSCLLLPQCLMLWTICYNAVYISGFLMSLLQLMIYCIEQASRSWYVVCIAWYNIRWTNPLHSWHSKTMLTSWTWIQLLLFIYILIFVLVRDCDMCVCVVEVSNVMWKKFPQRQGFCILPFFGPHEKNNL